MPDETHRPLWPLRSVYRSQALAVDRPRQGGNEVLPQNMVLYVHVQFTSRNPTRGYTFTTEVLETAPQEHRTTYPVFCYHGEGQQDWQTASACVDTLCAGTQLPTTVRTLDSWLLTCASRQILDIYRCRYILRHQIRDQGTWQSPRITALRIRKPQAGVEIHHCDVGNCKHTVEWEAYVAALAERTQGEIPLTHN